MEQISDPNIMPDYKAHRFRRTVDFLKRLTHFLPDQPLATHGDHLPHEEADELEVAAQE